MFSSVQYFDNNFKTLFMKTYLLILVLEIPLTIMLSSIEYYGKPHFILKYKISISKKKVI